MGNAASVDDPDRDPDEHVRFALCRRAFYEVAAEDAAALVTRVLTDPDVGMANGAVCEYLDRRAAELLTDPGYLSWCREMTGPVAVDDYSARRLREWSLARAMTLGEPWDVETLLGASNWLQLYTAEESWTVIALAELAEGGRTRRIRNIAKSRLPVARLPVADATRNGSLRSCAAAAGPPPPPRAVGRFAPTGAGGAASLSGSLPGPDTFGVLVDGKS
ncbi:hypothetical protein [Kitasatospora sp. NPDC002965]|uniref:hypothetical protein n=1 Tax=Kitasatospora sp. NPDC002965 TaxID=3154775 RepID=UPI0033A24C29